MAGGVVGPDQTNVAVVEAYAVVVFGNHDRLALKERGSGWVQGFQDAFVQGFYAKWAGPGRAEQAELKQGFEGCCFVWFIGDGSVPVVDPVADLLLGFVGWYPGQVFGVAFQGREAGFGFAVDDLVGEAADAAVLAKAAAVD